MLLAGLEIPTSFSGIFVFPPIVNGSDVLYGVDKINVIVHEGKKSLCYVKMERGFSVSYTRMLTLVVVEHNFFFLRPKVG